MNKLALRNLFRHRVRSAVTLAAIAFSTIVLVVAAGFLQWIVADLRRTTIETGLGHIQIVRAGFLEHGVADPTAFLLPDRSQVLAGLEETSHVVTVAQRLNVNGLLSDRDATLSFVGIGVEPGKEAVVSRNLTFLAGSNLTADSRDEVVVGEGLAANMGMKVGDRVVMLVSTASSSVSAVEATVRGIFSTQVRAFDEVAIRMPIGVARKLLRVSGAHTWVVSLDDVDEVDAVAAVLRSRLDAKQFEVVRWVDQSDFFTKTKTFLTGQLNVMRVLIAVIIVLGVSNMLIMNVLERTGEIGTLMAMGVRRNKVVALFLTESLYLAAIGGVIGVLLALLAARGISAIGIPMPPPPGRTVGYLGQILVDTPTVVAALAVTVATTLVAAIYPALKASRLLIVDALRFNR